jgi:hypothetical protein
MLIHYFFLEILAVVTFVFICCWIDKYILKRFCKKPDEVIIRDIIRDRIVTTDRNESELSEEDGYFTQTSEDSSHYSTETTDEETVDEETTNEIRMLKPDYDEETENEYGESLIDNESFDNESFDNESFDNESLNNNEI